MKLRLDEYYYVIHSYWNNIEEYMPKDMADKFIEFWKHHDDIEVREYISDLYSYIEVINPEYKIIYVDLEKGYITYKGIIKIHNKYYSFEYDYSYDGDFEDFVDCDQELIEVKPKEVTTIIYEYVGN